MRVEHELLLLCARTQVDEKAQQRIDAITSSPAEIDWDYLYRLARRHSVLPLVYYQLNQLDANIPEADFSRFRNNYRDNAARNSFLSAELCRLLNALETAGIEAVPYKGPALASYAYGNLALRRFVDLDILTRKSDVLQAKAVLEAQGYKCDVPWITAQETLLLKTQHNLSLSGVDGKLIVELHWEVASKLFASALQAEEFWGRLETTSLGNLPIKSLGAEDLLLSLCVHGSKHLWERLAWICDVAQIVRTRAGLNWATLLQRAETNGSSRMLLLGLCLANKLLDAPLPAQVIAAAKADDALPELVGEVTSRLFASSEPMAITIGQSFRFNWAVRSDLRSRLRYCRLLLQPTDADIETMRLPRPLTFVYYLMRPFALLQRDRRRREGQSLLPASGRQSLTR